MLNIPPVQLAYIVEKARAFDAETAPVDTDSGSNPSDDNEVAILEATADNPIQQELSAALNALDDEQRIEILALMWLGRGDFDRSEGRAALAQAREIHNAHETSYLLGTPLLADYLEEGIAALGSSLQDEKSVLFGARNVKRTPRCTRSPIKPKLPSNFRTRFIWASSGTTAASRLLSRLPAFRFG